MYLFVQSWDLVRGKEVEYTDFVIRRYMPAVKKLGLNVTGGFHVVVGAGPNISAVIAADDFRSLQKALDTDEFLKITGEFQQFFVNYSNRILRSTGRTELASYSIELGTWRLNQHYTLIPGLEEGYGRFLKDEYFPGLLAQGIRVKAEWQGLVGSGPYRILLEGVAQSIQDIAGALMSDEFGRLKGILLSNYVRQYSSRILAPTGRVETAIILREMTQAL
jgi:hypothetical protein